MEKKILKTKKVGYPLKLTEELWLSVKDESNKLGIAANSYMILAINDYVKK